MDCKHASRLMSQAMDHPLGWRKRLGLWGHLAICGMCRQFFKQLRLMRSVVRRMLRHAENDASVKLSDEARQRIRQVLDRRP